MYGPSTNPATNASNVLAYSNDVSWRNNASGKSVLITVSRNGLLSLSLDGVSIFTNVVLPPAYVSANKSGWAHYIKAATGGFSEEHRIDDIVIKTSNNVTYSDMLRRETVNAYGATGSGSACWDFYNLNAGEELSLTSYVFSSLTLPNSLRFDLSGATNTGGEVDTIFVEHSSNGGSSWTTIATLDNAPSTGEFDQSGASASAFEPTAAQWDSLSVTIPAGANRIRFRGVSDNGNRLYLDNLKMIPSCVAPTLSATTTATSCQGSTNGSINLTTAGGAPTPFTFQWSNGASTEDLSNLAAGTYTVTVTTAGCSATASYTVSSGPAPINNTTTISACNSYTWSLNSTTYTQSGTYSNVNGCTTDTLLLTITPSTTNTTTETANASYTWAVNGQTYTQSGTYTSNNACLTEILNLTIITACAPTQQPATACYETANWNTTTCQWDITGTQPAIPTLACYETATFNTTSCAWVVTGSQPSQPSLACYQTTTFNTTTCAWDVTGTQPTVPNGLACYQTATFNTTSCVWDITGSQPSMPTLACYETASFNSSTCVWDVTGTQPSAPTGLACYQTATFNTTSCAWDITGSQPSQPSLACYESATFNTTTCAWDVTGTPPSAPTGLACYETASFNSTTCAWDVTGTQPSQPSLACYESASYNTTTCVWVVTGTQPSAPSGLACYETATFNTTSCAWVVTGTQPSQPSLACYESANFNTTSCAWDVSGIQPSAPSGLACYETASFNTNSCSWNVTGTQPSAPSGLACYETATFNTTSCAWVVTGSPATAIVTNASSCSSYTWSANGTTYTQSGTYTYFANCQDYILNLSGSSTTIYYADVDGDGYGNNNSTTTSCNGVPTGYTTQAGDCNDTSATAYPGATEICNNGIDDNCDGITDEGTSVTANPISGNLSSCNMFAGSRTLTTTPIPGISNYNWTVPTDMTITSGQGTTSITVSWGNIYLLANGVIGEVAVRAMGSTTGCGTLIPARLPVDLNYAAPVTPSSISGPGAICPNQSGVYSIALVKRATSYEWSAPTGASITSGASPNIINVSYANGFTGGNITVGARNVCGLSTPLRNRTIRLNTLPAPSAIIGPVDGLCNVSNASYSATPVVGATGYNWTVPATESIISGSNNNNISVNFSASFATSTITVAAVNNCGAGATLSLSLKATPNTPGTITGPASACAGSTQSYAISTVQGTSNYIWTVPGGAVINSGQGTKNINVNHSTNASATGIITVRASNGCGTSAVRVLAVATTNCPRLGDATTQLEVYPNPANSFINLSFNVEQSQQATIILRDAAGRIVYNEAIDAIAGFNNQQIEVSNLAKGVYFVQLQTGASSENTRLIVE